jgi:hypothetical protein
MQLRIPSEALQRALTICRAYPGDDPWLKTIRYEDGLLIACEQAIMTIERVGGPAGVVHLSIPITLEHVIASEAPYKGFVDFVVTEAMQYVSAKTMLGYVEPQNAGYWSAEWKNRLDRWRNIVDQSRQSVAPPVGGMSWNCNTVAVLAKAAPSQCVIFEDTIDINRPVVIRDSVSEDWFAILHPQIKLDRAAIAILPDWV